MREKFKYLIEISIEEVSTINLFNGLVKYQGGSGREDRININCDRIILGCERSSLIDLDGVFKNYHSVMYAQIAKAVSFYICATSTIPRINDIKIRVERSGKLIKEKKISSTDLKSHVTLAAPFTGVFSPVSLTTMFDESPKGSALLKAISHLIRSKTKKDVFDRFDSLWKAYNAIYKIIGNGGTDHACHVALRTFVLANPAASVCTSAIVAGMTARELRKKLRWRDLILNDYEKSNKSIAFRDFVVRYTDARIMQVFHEILPYRKDFLTDAGLLFGVENHINGQLALNVSVHREVVVLICIKYMYFVRNKSAHGERLDRIISLGNKETKEMGWLNEILEGMIIDLINVNNLY